MLDGLGVGLSAQAQAAVPLRSHTERITEESAQVGGVDQPPSGSHRAHRSNLQLGPGELPMLLGRTTGAFKSMVRG